MADRRDVVLPAPRGDQGPRLAAAVAADDRDAVAGLVASDPLFLDGWAELAARGRDPIERYAYARVGYHRGLDALRANGWGGTGYCRWSHPTNRGFLQCLARLQHAAHEIGETNEVVRIAEFLVQLDPDWDAANVVV